MCFPTFSRQKTIEEIVAENSAGMTDSQKAEYWYQISQSIFALLGKVDIKISLITPLVWCSVVTAQYPTLTDIKIADSIFWVTTLDDLRNILSRDWANLVPFVAERGDCDDFAIRLYNHLCDYYQLNSVVPVWGDTTEGYHGFNLAVVWDKEQLIARLIEPQTDSIFIEQGPLGKYVPRVLSAELGILKNKLI